MSKINKLHQELAELKAKLEELDRGHELLAHRTGSWDEFIERYKSDTDTGDSSLRYERAVERYVAALRRAIDEFPARVDA
jgi:predicted RNase H-like nuclease (RuvC/YqgF family)